MGALLQPVFAVAEVSLEIDPVFRVKLAARRDRYDLVQNREAKSVRSEGAAGAIWVMLVSPVELPAQMISIP